MNVTTPTLVPPVSGDAAPIILPEHWQIRTAKQIMDEPATKPAWIIRDLLLKDSGTLVSGHPHSCKSLNWLCAAIESVSTHKVWNFFESPTVRRVLYIETEDPRLVVESRVRQFVRGLKISAD